MTDKVASDSLKPIETGEPEAGISRSMILGYGGYGVPRSSSSAGIRLTARQLFTLRKRHPFVAAVHNAIIKQVKKVELEVCPIDSKKPFSEETKGRMEKFLKYGFGELGEKEFRSRMIDAKKWYGDSFAEIVFDAVTKEPILANYIFAETMRILPDEHGQILGYPQVVDGQLVVTFPPENVMHLKEHWDEYSLFGWSDLESLVGALLLDALAEEHSTATLENDAVPAGILAFPNNIQETDIHRLRAQFIAQLRQNPNKPVFLNNTPQWIPMSIGTVKDMDYAELHRQVKEKVMMVYSVLPMQVAVVETGRLANPEQQLEIGEEYIRQELEVLQVAYNLKFTSRFQNNENLMIRFRELDPKLDAMKKEADILLTNANAAKTLASIPTAYTINEIRAMTGHEEVEYGEVPVPQPAQPQVATAEPNQSIIKAAPMEIQSLLFEKAQFTKDEAVEWAKSHNYKYGDVVETDQYWRLRQFDPGECTSGTERTVGLTDGINSVMCKRGKSVVIHRQDMELSGKPFAGYENFDDCVSQNSGKDNPEAYCATIMRETEEANPEKAFEMKALEIHKVTRVQGQKRLENDLTLLHEKFAKQAIKLAASNYPSEKSFDTKTVDEFMIALMPLLSILKDAMGTAVKKNAKDIYQGSKEALGFSFNQRDEAALEKLLSRKDGAMDAVESFTQDQKDGLAEVMRKSFEDGLSIPEMKKAMREFSDQENWKLERVARTESHRIATQGRAAGYKELEEERGEEYEYNWGPNPIDDRTSDECLDIINDNPYSLDEIMDVTNGGVVHPNERHSITRVVK